MLTGKPSLHRLRHRCRFLTCFVATSSPRADTGLVNGMNHKPCALCLQPVGEYPVRTIHTGDGRWTDAQVSGVSSMRPLPELLDYPLYSTSPAGTKHKFQRKSLTLSKLPSGSAEARSIIVPADFSVEHSGDLFVRNVLEHVKVTPLDPTRFSNGIPGGAILVHACCFDILRKACLPHVLDSWSLNAFCQRRPMDLEKLFSPVFPVKEGACKYDHFISLEI